MVRKKVKSKRMSLKDQHKIKRKVAEHHKKQRREARKNPSARKKLSKDPAIPKLWGVQQDLMNKMPEEKRRNLELKKQEEESRKRKRSDVDQLNSMVKSASKREKQFVDQEALIKDLGQFNMKDSSKKAFFTEFRKVVKASDVILEVLDARDPLGSRSIGIEKSILSLDPNKKIILLLNKIDLVPKKNVEEWLKYLRNEYPTLAFKASTQKQKSSLGRGKGKIKDMTDKNLKVSACLGADNLMSLLKNYARSSNMKQAINVGIIGFPNVGKSSVINSLKRERAVNVGAKAGVTTTTQEIVLDKNVKLIDCPGIVFSSDMSESDAALRNCLNLEQLDDFTLPVQAILNRCSKENLVTIYSIPNFIDVMDFLRLVALKRGKVLQGGVADYQTAARLVIQDWNAGRIPYYTIPPETDPSIHVGAEIVNTWGEAFKLDDVMETEQQNVLSSLNTNDADFVYAASKSIKTYKPDAMFENLAAPVSDESVEEMSGSEDDDDSDDSEEEMGVESYRKETIVAVAPIKEKKKTTDPSPAKKRKVDPSNPQTNQEANKKQKEQRKAQKQHDRKSGEGQAKEAFDFGVDFWSNTTPVADLTQEKTDSKKIVLDDVDAFTF